MPDMYGDTLGSKLLRAATIAIGGLITAAIAVTIGL